VEGQEPKEHKHEENDAEDKQANIELQQLGEVAPPGYVETLGSPTIHELGPFNPAEVEG